MILKRLGNACREKLLYGVRRWHISAKITLVYTLTFFVVLLAINICTGLGVYYALYYQAEVALSISMRQTLERLETGERFNADFLNNSPLLPSVVLRVTDASGQVVFDTDAHYPSIEMIESAKRSAPFWAAQSLDVSELRRSTIYSAKASIAQDGASYTLHFFRTITAEKQLFAKLQEVLIFIDVLGLILAVVVGYRVSKNIILKPVRTMTQSARRIEVEHMDERIPVLPVQDELTELAQTFNHMLDRLEAGFQQQQRFVSDASHELRTPTTVILGYSDLLNRWGQEDAAILKEGIAAIHSEAENMQQLIEKLLFLARADQRRQVLRKEWLEMSDLVEDVMRKMKLVTKGHAVKLLQNDAGKVYADQVILRQMLRIFLENSVKYTPEGGEITVTSVNEGEFLHLTVADNGIGIAEEHQDKIFERFYRVDSSRTRAKGEIKGTGLGLSIAQWIAEQHGIDIRLESEPGKGTRIHLRIPMGSDAAGKGDAPGAEKEAGQQLS